MSNQRLLTIPTFEIMLEHHAIMREVIREMDNQGEPYVRERSFVRVIHDYMHGLPVEKKNQLTAAFGTENLKSSRILVDRDEFGGESLLIFDKSVIGIFRLFDESLFQDLTDVALKTHLGGLRLLLDQLDCGAMSFVDSDLDYKELIDELFHRLSELLNSIRLNIVKMESINRELSEASEKAAKSHDSKLFLLHQRQSIEQISHLLARHILPTRQFLDEKSLLKDGPNLFGCLQKFRRLFDVNRDYNRSNAMLRYEITFNSFHTEISKVSHSVDQFLARSKKRMKQFNAIESAFQEVKMALDETKQNLKRSQIDGDFARQNGWFLGLQQHARPKVLRISSSQAYLNNVISDIEARVTDREMLRQTDLSLLESSYDNSTEIRLDRARVIKKIISQMEMCEYQDLTLAVHRRLQPHLPGYHFIDLLEGLNFMAQGELRLKGHKYFVTNIRQHLVQGDTAYIYRKIRTESEAQ